MLPASARQGISSSEISLDGGPFEESGARPINTERHRNCRAAKTIYERQRGNGVKEMHKLRLLCGPKEERRKGPGLRSATDEREFRSRTLHAAKARPHL